MEEYVEIKSPSNRFNGNNINHTFDELGLDTGVSKRYVFILCVTGD